MVDITTKRLYHSKNILRGGAENIARESKPDQVRHMVAAEKAVRTETPDKDATGCRVCFGTGVVSHWNEIAYFEDRRLCARCEAGRRVDAKIADIVRRALLEERLS